MTVGVFRPPTGCSAAPRYCACPTWPSTAATSRIPAPTWRWWPLVRMETRWPTHGSRWPVWVGDPSRGGTGGGPCRYTWRRCRRRSTIDYSDFTVWSVQRDFRCGSCGAAGRGRRAEDSARADPLAAHTAAPSSTSTPTTPHAARGWRGCSAAPDTESAICTGVDRYGLDLKVDTPRGNAYTRWDSGGGWGPVDGLRSATVELVRRARQA